MTAHAVITGGLFGITWIWTGTMVLGLRMSLVSSTTAPSNVPDPMSARSNVTSRSMLSPGASSPSLGQTDIQLMGLILIARLLCM
ncbi:MAG: hypothetical protein BWY92_01461 [Firmicutes bacterium ADurb.BinA052]|nr:MAG: hypothetical protein BWY92_01461 [Firmicutes bacterium ADurb.BinA052]